MEIEYIILLRKTVKVYGDRFFVELRKYRSGYFQLVDVYANCEHDRGCPYETTSDAIRGFEAACGVTLTEDLKKYLEKNEKEKHS